MMRRTLPLAFGGNCLCVHWSLFLVLQTFQVHVKKLSPARCSGANNLLCKWTDQPHFWRDGSLIRRDESAIVGSWDGLDTDEWQMKSKVLPTHSNRITSLWWLRSFPVAASIDVSHAFTVLLDYQGSVSRNRYKNKFTEILLKCVY